MVIKSTVAIIPSTTLQELVGKLVPSAPTHPHFYALSSLGYYLQGGPSWSLDM